MAYADQQGMSTNRLVSIIVVVLLHAFLGYALVTGLAFEAVKKVNEKLNVIDIEEEKPPEEEPPPPPPDDVLPPPPEVVTPPSPFPRPDPNPIRQSDNIEQEKPALSNNYQCWDNTMVNNATQCRPRPERYTCPGTGQIVEQPSQCPKVEDKSKPARPSNSPGGWANSNDYPDSEIRAKKEGTTGFRVTVGPNGRVTDCQVTSSSGSSRLDSIACQKIKSRAKFTPALDKAGNPTSGSYSNSIRWVLPKD